MAKAIPQAEEVKVPTQEEIEERALEADRLARYALSDPWGLELETQRTEERLVAKYK